MPSCHTTINHNNGIREHQSIDGRTDDEINHDIDTATASNVLYDHDLQSNLDVQRGLRQDIPGPNTSFVLSDGTSMSIAAARKKFKPDTTRNKRHSSANNNNDETPPAAMFIANANNRQYHNDLCSLPLNPQSATSRMYAPPRALASIREEHPVDDMSNRVKSRLFKTMISTTEASPVKSSAAKAYDKLSKNDSGIINLVSTASSSGIQSSQELATYCIDYQRRLGN